MTPQQARALVPAAVAAWSGRGADQATWVDALPRLLSALCEEWDLRPDGEVRHGRAALVVPVSGADEPAVLKLGYVDEGSEHEALALQRWGGRGAVRLLRADPRRGALLLERLPGPDLGEEWDQTACEIVAGLYGELHAPAPPQLRSATGWLTARLGDLERLPRSAPLPRRLVEQALGVGRALAADPGSRGRLVHGDLHYAHVRARAADEWVVTGPEPLSGDPHGEPAPMLWHRWDDVVASGDVRDAVRRRFHTLLDGADLDEDRARDWAVVRTVLAAAAHLHAVDAAGRAPDRSWLTRWVAVAKAVQE